MPKKRFFNFILLMIFLAIEVLISKILSAMVWDACYWDFVSGLGIREKSNRENDKKSGTSQKLRP